MVLRYAVAAISQAVSLKKPVLKLRSSTTVLSFLRLLYKEGLILGWTEVSPSSLFVYPNLRVGFTLRAFSFCSSPLSSKRVALLSASPNILFLSTSRGILTGKQAALLNIGGRPVATYVLS